MSELSRHVIAAALANLRLSPRRMRALLFARPSLHEVWETVVGGHAGDLASFTAVLGDDRDAAVERCTREARNVDLADVEARIVASGTTVHILGDGDYPPRLAADQDPPAVVFERGAAALDPLTRRPTVAIVGTRRCTAYGRDVASALGRDLASAGVVVVSGLALGIDGAAHEGALAPAADGAPPVAVVGSGIDVVYPRRHRRLWDRVAEVGVIVAEAPMGGRADPYRFPLRNRIIASLADLVIVVESHAAGGSMHTVQAAIDRSVPVMAVPGSIRSPSSAGTNRLLADGVAPVLDVADVLVALSLSAASTCTGSGRSQRRQHVEGVDADVLEAVDWQPTSTEVVLQRTGLALGVAAAALTRMEMAGFVRSQGGWWERC